MHIGRMSEKKLKIIGRHEKASLPEIGLQGIVVKTDTGAYTSSLHCKKAVMKDNRLICEFLNPHDDEDSVKKVTFAAFKKRKVKSSNGQMEERYSVQTKIKLGHEIYPIEVTLTDRHEMKYPMLLGRKFLNKKFVVDVSQKNSLTKN
jgi:hypothetical protein